MRERIEKNATSRLHLATRIIDMLAKADFMSYESRKEAVKLPHAKPLVKRLVLGMYDTNRRIDTFADLYRLLSSLTILKIDGDSPRIRRRRHARFIAERFYQLGFSRVRVFRVKGRPDN